jgi:uncharacterized protein (TIGR02147 family)
LEHIVPKTVVIGPLVGDNSMHMILEARSVPQFLSEELQRRLKSNPRYSQRAFSRQLGLSPGELSEILRGKRGLSLKSALRIGNSLGLNPTETKHLVELAQIEKSRRMGEEGLALPEVTDTHGEPLTLDVFHIVSDWTCFAILNLTDCEGFQSNPNWMAKKLAIAPAEARIAWERLERVGLVEKKNGKWVSARDMVLSPTGIPSTAIRNYHRQILGKAIEALETHPVSERDITGIGFAVDPKHLPAIRKEISDFQDRLIARFSKGKKTEVYQLEMALFRLTAPLSSLSAERSSGK